MVHGRRERERWGAGGRRGREGGRDGWIEGGRAWVIRVHPTATTRWGPPLRPGLLGSVGCRVNRAPLTASAARPCWRLSSPILRMIQVNRGAFRLSVGLVPDGSAAAAAESGRLASRLAPRSSLEHRPSESLVLRVCGRAHHQHHRAPISAPYPAYRCRPEFPRRSPASLGAASGERNS